MSTKEKIIESLIIKVEGYSKTNLELLKLKTVNRTGDVISRISSRLLFLLIFAFFMLFINLGLSIWIGKKIGELYLGFVLVAGFYGLISLVLLIVHKPFVTKMKDRIISQLLN